MAQQQICGWETGNSREQVSATGTTSQVAGAARSGDFGLRINPTGAAQGFVQVGGVRATIGDTTATALNSGTLYFLFALRIVTAPAASSEEFFGVYGQGGSVMLRGRVNSDRTLGFYSAGTTLLATSTYVVPSNTWVAIGIKHPIGTASTACEVKIYTISADGSAATLQETVACTGDFSYDGTNPGSIALGKVNNRNSQDIDLHYDDLIIDDAAYPSLQRVLRLDPDSNGDTFDWSANPNPGAGSEWSNLDDNPHDSDTTYCNSSTSGQIALTGFETLANAGAAGVLSIGSVKLTAIVRDEGTGGENIIFRIRSGAANSSSTGSDPGASYTGRFRHLSADPATVGVWTESSVNAVQGGVVNNANVAVRSTQHAMMVAYVQSAGASDDMNRLLLLGVG